LAAPHEARRAKRGAPWPTIVYYHNKLNLNQFSSSIAADTNTNTNKLMRGISWQK
jgi:hypothetical protein